LAFFWRAGVLLACFNISDEKAARHPFGVPWRAGVLFGVLLACFCVPL